MSRDIRHSGKEPSISVGLIQRADHVRIRLSGSFSTHGGVSIPPGDYAASLADGLICLSAPAFRPSRECLLQPVSPESRFSIETTIGIDFHWEQKEIQTFCGILRLIIDSGKITVINDVPLETYLASVICSEMSAAAPSEFTKAHSVISRSWLLAQIEAPPSPTSLPASHCEGSTTEIIRWYDRQAHTMFDVCADDHCQRYQGVGKITDSRVHQDIRETRGLIMMHGDSICDARFSKCCGGVVEEFRTAWSENDVPYLVPLTDADDTSLTGPPLTDENAFRLFLGSRPPVYCNCQDPAILSKILPHFDQKTTDYFRWTVRLPNDEASSLIKTKSGVDLGSLVSMEPIERGPSGRLKRLRIKGTKGTLIIGKELEIRRILSKSHLYSSAFVVETEGPPDHPSSFVLRGAGWGHGVGLCQIGAAVMACRGKNCSAILSHYYPETRLVRLY